MSQPPRHAVALVGLAVFAVGLATTLPLPLYGTYVARGGHGAGSLSVAFACYALTLIISAPLLGPLPDRIGRRRCVLAGLVFAGLSTLVLALVPSVPALAVARVAQGLGMGLVTGAGAAWAAELAGGGPLGGRRAAGVIAAATIGSFTLGVAATLLWVWMVPGTLRPPTFPAHLLLIVLLLWPLARLPETLAVPPGEDDSRWSRFPRGGWLRWPAFPRGTLATTLAILPAWGTTSTVLTSALAIVAAQGMPLLGPLAACGMMGFGVAAQRAFAGVAPRPAVRIGLRVLVVSSGAAFLGAVLVSVPLLILGAAGVGVGVYAFLYRGGLAAVSEAATGEERARAVAGYFVVAHLGFSIVPMLAGLAVDRFGAGPALGGLWLAILASAIGLGVAIRR